MLPLPNKGEGVLVCYGCSNKYPNYLNGRSMHYGLETGKVLAELLSPDGWPGLWAPRADCQLLSSLHIFFFFLGYSHLHANFPLYKNLSHIESRPTLITLF